MRGPIREGDPHGYSSHLRILRMVLALVQPERVLELGAGQYSTPEFLKCESVEHLTSLESDPEWATQMTHAIEDDRLNLQLVEDLPAAVPSLTGYDLVFVDNGQSVHERVAGIRAVLERPHPVTVIHDAEVPDYRLMISQLAEDYMVFDHPQHQTAVCW